MGLSLGGNVRNKYILFTQPELFKGYIIIAPFLGEQIEQHIENGR